MCMRSRSLIELLDSELEEKPGRSNLIEPSKVDNQEFSLVEYWPQRPGKHISWMLFMVHVAVSGWTINAPIHVFEYSNIDEMLGWNSFVLILATKALFWDGRMYRVDAILKTHDEGHPLKRSFENDPKHHKSSLKFVAEISSDLLNTGCEHVGLLYSCKYCLFWGQDSEDIALISKLFAVIPESTIDPRNPRFKFTIDFNGQCDKNLTNNLLTSGNSQKVNSPVSGGVGEPYVVVQIVLWYLDSGCSRHMTGDRARLINFVDKFIGTVRFGNDEYAAIIGYGDYKLGDTIISRVYYVEGLKHNLFSVGQFCDGGLEVAFRQHSCHIRNYDMVDLLKGSRTTNLYSISLNDMMSASPVCLLTKASSTKSWLWHRRLNHLNFGTLNELARKNLVRGLPMLKYAKDHLCPSCQLGKSKKASHPLKTENTNTEVLNTLHMDLCGPMRTESINGKKYVLVIVDDYTRFGWVRFLRTKDETPQVIEKFIVKTQRALNATVRFVRTDNGTEFVNKTLDGWFESVGISHETSVPRSPQQNGVVERRNRTLMEAARTMLIFAKAPLFLWAEAVATACYTLNRSLVHTLHGKTYYELLKGKKPNLQYFRVFGSLCYPTNDYDDVGKLKAKADIVTEKPHYLIKYLYQTLVILMLKHCLITVDSNVFDTYNAPETDSEASPPTLSISMLLPTTNCLTCKSGTQAHPLENIIGDKDRPVSTRKQLETDANVVFFNEVITSC
ncbi:retrovirus-related pol polyprotein from transposon TNT 1-94 [Tanacetum coccineum]